MHLFYIVTFFVFGIVFGSFFNVIGIRVPKKISFHNDRSYCPQCETQLRFFELIPILSYIMQGGKCRSCKTKISFVYPFIELSTGLLFTYAYLYFGLQLELIVALLLISLLMIIFVSDIFYMLIPNKVLLFFLPLILIARIFIPLDPWYDALIGALVGYVLLAVIIIVSKGGDGCRRHEVIRCPWLCIRMEKSLAYIFPSSIIRRSNWWGFNAWEKSEKG